MTTEADALILRYLQDLESQLQDLPAGRRQELLDEVGAHISAARADLDPETEAGVRTLLERLGDPADIAAEARERPGVPPPRSQAPTPWLEIVAVVAPVIPFLGWLVGVVLVWVSRIWTVGDKLVGTFAGLSWVLAGLGVAIAPLAQSASDSPLGSPPVDVAPEGPELLAVLLVVAPFVLPFVAAIYLGLRLRRLTAAAGPPA